jgi:hypothetical protein
MSKAKAYHLIEDYPNKLYYTIAEVADDIGMGSPRCDSGRTSSIY